MSEHEIQAAAQAATAAALPGAADWSNDPHNVRPDKLDAFVVAVIRDTSGVAAMGSDLEEVRLTIEVEVFGKFNAGQDGRAIFAAKGRAVREALRSDAALAALVDQIIGSTLDVDLAQGETRLARATVSLTVEATF